MRDAPEIRSGDLYKKTVHLIPGLNHIRHRNPDFDRILFVFFGVFLFLGAAGISAGAIIGLSKGLGINIKESSFIRSVFAPVIPVPGEQKDGAFVFASFEEPSEFKPWELQSARIEFSDQYYSHGTHSGKVTFFGPARLASVSIEDYFTSRHGLSNWQGYDKLEFYAYNPSATPHRIILQVKDRAGKRYKQEFHVPSRGGQAFGVELGRMHGKIDIRYIDQIVLFVWDIAANQEFYIDNVRLLPKDYIPSLADDLANLRHSAGPKERPTRHLDYGFEFKKRAWMAQDMQGLGAIVRIPFIVRNETGVPCNQCGVTGGVPMPMGELTNLSNLRLRDSGGRDLPFQMTVLSEWPDKSVRWLRVNFEATLAPGHGTGFFLEYGGNIQTIEFRSQMRVQEDAQKIRVQTGPLEVDLSKDKFFLFDRVGLDANNNGMFEADEDIVRDARLYLRAQNKDYWTDLDKENYKIEVEETGPHRTVVKATGWFTSTRNKPFCKLVMRYYFFEGQDYVHVAHTWIYTGYPENNQYEPYLEERLPKNETIDSFGMTVPFRFGSDEPLATQLGQSSRLNARAVVSPLRFNQTENLRSLQNEFDDASVMVNETEMPFEQAMSGWMNISDGFRGVTVALRDYRENFPKAFSVNKKDKSIQIDLWPAEAGELDLRTTPDAVSPEAYGRGSAFGVGKTHELLFHFHTDSAEKAQVVERAESFRERLILRNNPFWVDASGALGRLNPIDARYGKQEVILERVFDWADRHPKTFRWYGMLNYGDTLTWWRNEDDNKWYGEYGWHPNGRWGWYNCEGVGTHTGALLQFARGGGWKYFEFGENLARHIMDVDTIHYDTISNDPRLNKKLDPVLSQVGSMHRHNGDHWGGRSDEAAHTSVVGLVLYHYLSGDERVRDVIDEIGSFYLKEPITFMGHPDKAQGRSIANVIWGNLLLYELTQDESYKRGADKLLNILLSGQQPDGSFLDFYNPLSKSWSGRSQELPMTGYIMGALIKYHEVTQDEEVKETIVRLARYLSAKQYAAPVSLHGLAYAYLITRDPFFIKKAEETMKYIQSQQQINPQNPLIDGLIYKKPIYHRPMAFLSTMPYVFGALEEDFLLSRKGRMRARR